MARKRMKSKIQPAVQTLVFTGPEIETDEDRTMFIDLSQCASLVNRRFYRQGLNWAVSSIRVIARPSSLSDTVYCPVTIQKLPNTWVMSNAWEKGFRAWQHMIKNATDDAGNQSIKGKYLDFKIYADARHHSSGFANNLIPIDAVGNSANLGQWQPAEIEVPSLTGAAVSQAWEIIAVGPNNPGASPASGLDAKSLIAGYEVSRALPYSEDPNSPVDSSNVGANWIMSMFTDGTQQDPDVIEMLEVTGDQAPYPYEGSLDPAGVLYTDTQYPGGENNLPALEIHDESVISSTTVSSTLHLKGGNFPCGLIGVRFNNFATGSAQRVYWDIYVDLVPGTHRGYLAEPMTEM